MQYSSPPWRIQFTSADMMPGGYRSVDVSGHRSKHFTTIVTETRRVRTADERRAIVDEACRAIVKLRR